MENDFGFSAVTEEEFKERVQPAQPDRDPAEQNLIMDRLYLIEEKIERLYDQRLEASTQSSDERLKKVEGLIIPLLDNLIKSAEKSDYIFWPNRKTIIEQQKRSILEVTRG